MPWLRTDYRSAYTAVTVHFHNHIISLNEMSSVTLQVGQCGNQIGYEFLKLTTGSKTVSSYDLNAPRSIHVDSEPKVLQKLFGNGELGIPNDNVLYGRLGRGTNWALGYHGTRFGNEDRILEEVTNRVRKEAERCSAFSGVVMIHSLGGGTGSGMGSRLCEYIRDEFALQHIVSCVVAPHVTGDSPLQNYNALLCLAHLQKYSDAVVMFSNDEILNKLQKDSKGRECGVSMDSVNACMARYLGGALFPTDTLTPRSGVSLGVEPWEMVRSVCPMPSTKFVHIQQVNQSKASWEKMATLLGQRLSKFSNKGEVRYRSLAGIVVGRGDKTLSFQQCQSQVEAKLTAAYNPVSWNPYPLDYWTERTCSIASSGVASLTVAANHSIILDTIGITLNSAWVKYKAQAYLHWYYKYGCQEGDFEEAFDVVEQVLSNYKEAIA